MSIFKNIVLPSHYQRPFLADIRYVTDGRPKPLIILTHGFQGFKDWGPYNIMAETFVKAGFVFVKFNMSHNGTTIDHPVDFVDLEAFGNNNFTKELDDLGVVIDWVCSEEFPVSKTEVNIDQLYLVGHSRGGGIVMLKAGEDKRVKKISTWAAVNEFGKFWKSDQMKKIKEVGAVYVQNGRTKQQMPVYWQMYENYFANLKRFYIPDVVKSLSIPTFVVHGTKDETVPYTSATEIKEWNSKVELLLIQDGNHVFGGKHPWEEDHLPDDLKRVVDETIKFFKQ